MQGRTSSPPPLVLVILIVFAVGSPAVAVTGDLNRDGVVNFDDFFIFADNFNRTGSPEDADTIVVTVRDTVTVTLRDTITITVHDTVFVDSSDTSSTGGTPLFFGDPNLESAVRDALSKPTGNLLSGEVGTLTFLNASNRNIVVLTGIENLTGLTSLTLSDNQIIDISPLEQLTALCSLTLANNQVRDVSALVANSGIATGATVVLTGNPLVNLATSQQIPALVARGATVSADPTVVTFADSSLQAVVRTALATNGRYTLHRSRIHLFTRCHQQRDRQPVRHRTPVVADGTSAG